MNFRDDENLKPQRGAIPEGAKDRIWESICEEMAKANEAVAAKPYGVELAERAGAAARAAILVLIDAGNPDTPPVGGQVLLELSHRAYTLEWQRLANTQREEWHK